MFKQVILASVTLLFVMQSQIIAETTVTLKGVHLCCGSCVKGVKTAAVKIDGITAAVDNKAKTVKVTGKDDATVQKALDSIGSAGFYGTSDHKTLKIKTSEAKSDKVARYELFGIHNCCAGCNKAIKEIITKVDGVTGTNIKPKAKSFVVEGNFDPSALITALNDAGFQVKNDKTTK